MNADSETIHKLRQLRAQLRERDELIAALERKLEDLEQQLRQARHQIQSRDRVLELVDNILTHEEGR